MSKREETEKELRAKFEALKAHGIPTGPSAFCKQAGIHRTYLYTFPVLAAEISAYGRETQPNKTRRGRWVSTEEATKRQVGAKMRREHAQWSKELPELQNKLTEFNKLASDRVSEVTDLRGKLERLRRMYELLLLLAVEAGVSPNEIERMQETVGL